MKRISFLPSLLTISNFICGFIAIYLCLQSTRLHELGQERAAEFLTYACAVVFIAMIFDVLDGRVARMTGTVSRFGGELDSLADDCTFGITPAVIVCTLWIQAQPTGKEWYGLVLLCGAIYASCAIIRLARYNVEIGTADKNYFTGLPSPAAAGAVVSAVLFCRKGYLDTLWVWITPLVPQAKSETMAMQAYVLGVYMLIVGVMMVSRLRFVHVANRYIGGRRRLTTFVAFLFLIGLMGWYPVEMLFLAFNGYVVSGLLSNIPRHRKRTSNVAPSSQPTPTDAVS